MKPSQATPVLVLTCRRQGGLGIVRSLGRMGVPVWAVEQGRLSAPLLSRYLQGRFQWDLDSRPAGESVQFLLAAARKIGRRAILVPTTDAGAVFVSAHAAELRDSFDFHALPPELVTGLSNKK